MTNTLDNLLKALPPLAIDRSLDQLEPAVWSRIDAARSGRAVANGSFSFQLVAAGMALVIGLAMGWSMSARQPADGIQSLYASYAELGPMGRLEGGL